MAKEKTFTDLKLKLAEALDALDVNSPDLEMRQTASEISNAVGKYIRLDALKIQYDSYRKSGGKKIISLED